jgi:hypothetical protein
MDSTATQTGWENNRNRLVGVRDEIAASPVQSAPAEKALLSQQK